MSWALIAATAMKEIPHTVIAASHDIKRVIETDGHLDYLTIFPEEPGVYLWTGTIVPTSEEVQCDGQAVLLHDVGSPISLAIAQHGEHAA